MTDRRVDRSFRTRSSGRRGIDILVVAGGHSWWPRLLGSQTSSGALLSMGASGVTLARGDRSPVSVASVPVQPDRRGGAADMTIRSSDEQCHQLRRQDVPGMIRDGLAAFTANDARDVFTSLGGICHLNGRAGTLCRRRRQRQGEALVAARWRACEIAAACPDGAARVPTIVPGACHRRGKWRISKTCRRRNSRSKCDERG